MRPEYINTLLISPGELKNDSLINQNVDDKPLSNIVQTTQEIYLVKITGTALMRRLQELVYNESKGEGEKISDYENYLDLWENYVKPYIKYRVLKSFVVENSFKLRNAGTVRVTDTNMNYSGVDDIKFLQQHFGVYVAEYEQRLSKYLCDNRENFKELEAEIPSYMDEPTFGKDYSATAGLWLGPRSNKNNRCGNGCK